MKKLVFIINSKSCVHCRVFKPLTDSKEFKAGVADYEILTADLKVNPAEYAKLFAKYGKGVTVYPTIVVVDGKGRVTGRVVGRRTHVKPFTAKRVLEMIAEACGGCGTSSGAKVCPTCKGSGVIKA